MYSLYGAVANGATDGAADVPVVGSSLPMILMLVGVFAFFYFFMIRPDKKKQKKLEEMRSALAVGDTVTTIGGIIGKVVSVDDDKITFETSEDRVRVQVAKWAISTSGKQTEEPK